MCDNIHPMRVIFLQRVSGFLPTVLTTLTLCFAFTVGGTVAHAQPPGSRPPADIEKVFSDIGDLDLLKALVPLHLTATQLEKLQVPLKEIVADNVERRKTDYEALRGIAAEVTKARESALAGETITTDLENKILRVFNTADDRFAKAKQDAINKVFAVTKDVFTADQKDEVERQVGKMLGGKRLIPKEYRNDPKKAPKEAVQDLAIQMYIERILIADRTADLLSKLKPVTPPAKP